MEKNNQLLTGNIFSALTSLALPIMGTSFLHIAYHLVDMIWIGIIGSDAVASIGVASYFIMFSMALIRLIQIGTEVNVAQSIGSGNGERANRYAGTALFLAASVGIFYSMMLFIFNRQLIGFFNIGSEAVVAEARNYLFIMAAGMVFIFMNPVITCIYNGSGYSKAAFKVNAMGMVANVVLDPLFIFVFGLGVRGAAIATILSQALVTVILLVMLQKNRPFPEFHFSRRWHSILAADIAKLGAPVALQSGLFTIFSIFLARIVAFYGPDAIAAQKVGVQIESISYMTANGFAVALSSFTGQNYGAGRTDRVRSGIITAGLVMTGFGITTSLILYFFATELFMIFIREPGTVLIGTAYVRILALSQLFMCLEISLAGGFNGLRKTLPPAVVGILFTGLRVPVAYLISTDRLLGLEGVWWTITGSSVIKGSLMLVMIIYLTRSLQAAAPVQPVDSITQTSSSS